MAIDRAAFYRAYRETVGRGLKQKEVDVLEKLLDESEDITGGEEIKQGVMTTSVKGQIELASSEGIATQPYYDTKNVTTIGIGATHSEIPDLAQWPKTREISISEVFQLFKKSLGKYEKAVNEAVKVKLTQPQFDALVHLCYNIGTAGLKGSTLVKRINAGETSPGAIKAAFMMWTKDKELIGRRTKEAALYTTGKYQSNGKAQLYVTGGTGRIQHSKTKTINLLDYIDKI